MPGMLSCKFQISTDNQKKDMHLYDSYGITICYLESWYEAIILANLVRISIKGRCDKQKIYKYDACYLEMRVSSCGNIWSWRDRIYYDNLQIALTSYLTSRSFNLNLLKDL